MPQTDYNLDWYYDLTESLHPKTTLLKTTQYQFETPVTQTHYPQPPSNPKPFDISLKQFASQSASPVRLIVVGW